MKTLILILSLICSCSTSKIKKGNCDKNQVKKITDDLMRKKGYDITFLNMIIDESLDAYAIKYIPKDTLSLGGGAEVKISKKDCQIIEQKFYQ
jgi:hypothetical protein